MQIKLENYNNAIKPYFYYMKYINIVHRNSTKANLHDFKLQLDITGYKFHLSN